MEQVLQHLQDPLRGLDEMIRVTRSGGKLAVLEPDWETLVIDADDAETTRRILHSYAVTFLPNGGIGRWLFATCKDSGLMDVSLIGRVIQAISAPVMIDLMRQVSDHTVAEGPVTRDKADAWVTDMDRRSREGRYFVAACFFTVTATKPA